MNQWQTYLYCLFISGFICSTLLFLQGNTSAKSGFETACACVMLIVFLFPLTNFDLTESLNECSFSSADEMNAKIYSATDDYTRQVMEQEYRAYIFSRADEFGIVLTDIGIDMEKDKNGYWIPCSVIYGAESSIDATFFNQIEMDLGVPVERQNTYEAISTY